MVCLHGLVRIKIKSISPGGVMVATLVLEASAARRESSSLSWGTTKLALVQMDSTVGFYPTNTGSTPVGRTIQEAWQSPVYCNSLENCRLEKAREFKSHRFRHTFYSWCNWQHVGLQNRWLRFKSLWVGQVMH